MTPIQLLTERERLRNTKMKDMRYFIKGIDSDKPALQCLSAILLGFIFPLVLAIIIRLVDYLITGV